MGGGAVVVVGVVSFFCVVRAATHQVRCGGFCGVVAVLRCGCGCRCDCGCDCGCGGGDGGPSHLGVIGHQFSKDLLGGERRIAAVGHGLQR